MTSLTPPVVPVSQTARPWSRRTRLPPPVTVSRSRSVAQLCPVVRTPVLLITSSRQAGVRDGRALVEETAGAGGDEVREGEGAGATDTGICWYSLGTSTDGGRLTSPTGRCPAPSRKLAYAAAPSPATM